MFYLKKIFVVISVRLIISTSAELIFTGFVELWSEINNLNFFSILQGTLLWQPILWAKSTCNTHLVVFVTFARAAPQAYTRRAVAMQGAGKQIT